MMNTRKNRSKRVKLDNDEYVAEFDQDSISSDHNDRADEQDLVRKSRIRDSNKEFAKRMTILQSWSEFWIDYTTRDGEAYSQAEARAIIKAKKKITCPIESCGKSFISIGGLKYHYARCNIERSFKCKVCIPPLQVATRGELLRHMILNHYEVLPSLNDDQKEIANSYLSCDTRLDKSRKTTSDAETLINGYTLVKAFAELQKRICCSESFNDRPFKDWQSSMKSWQLIVKEFDRRRYYPPELESIQFKSDFDGNWINLKTGESSILDLDDAETSSTIFYTGGINTSSDWLPKSIHDKQAIIEPDLVAVSVSCCSMDQSLTYKESHYGEGCIQFWTITSTNNLEVNPEQAHPNVRASLSYMIGHDYGTIFRVVWCPLGTSWQPQIDGENVSRVGLLALACGDGKIRILDVPYTNKLLSKATSRLSATTIEATPIFRVEPIAILIAPGVGPSTDYQTAACKSICWNLEDNQRLIAAGYANGTVALFDLSNNSPILYANTGTQHIYQPLKSWAAHGAPVTGVAISSSCIDRTLIATGSIDRQFKLWNPMDRNSCITTDKAPITKILWDYRFRGVITATDTAFTSFNNKVSYRYPSCEGNHSVTVSAHRSTVWGLANSIITNSIATSDGAGEVFVIPLLINRPLHKRDRSVLSTHSLYTMIPKSLVQENDTPLVSVATNECNATNENQEPAETKESIKSQNDIETATSTKENQETNETNSEAEVNHELGDLQMNADFSMVERPMANRPTKFLLPVEHRPIETYSDFKTNFGLEFLKYNTSTAKQNSKIPESCLRAGDTKDIYCDRPCDYPFSSINDVSWSPNVNTFQYLLSATQVGLCRIDKVQIVEQVYKGHIESILPQNTNAKQ